MNEGETLKCVLRNLSVRYTVSSFYVLGAEKAKNNKSGKVLIIFVLYRGKQILPTLPFSP
jgi:hypothetical protein